MPSCCGVFDSIRADKEWEIEMSNEPKRPNRASLDRVYEANDALNDAIATMCAEETPLPVSVRHDINKASAKLACFCLMRDNGINNDVTAKIEDLKQKLMVPALGICVWLVGGCGVRCGLRKIKAWSRRCSLFHTCR